MVNRTYSDYFAPSYVRVFKALTNNSNWDIVIKRNYEILAAVSGQYGATGTGGSQNYYAQSLRVIMLVMSGNFVDFTQP